MPDRETSCVEQLLDRTLHAGLPKPGTAENFLGFLPACDASPHFSQAARSPGTGLFMQRCENLKDRT